MVKLMKLRAGESLGGSSKLATLFSLDLKPCLIIDFCPSTCHSENRFISIVLNGKKINLPKFAGFADVGISHHFAGKHSGLLIEIDRQNDGHRGERENGLIQLGVVAIDEGGN